MSPLFENGIFDNVRESLAFMKEKTAVLKCETTSTIGIIPMRTEVTLRLDPTNEVLLIRRSQKQIVTLPYERVLGFYTELDTIRTPDETSNIAGSVLSSGLLGRGAVGKIGMLAGGLLSGREKITNHWIVTLIYRDKEGVQQCLRFLEKDESGYYDSEEKSVSASKFESVINEIATRYGDNLTEL